MKYPNKTSLVSALLEASTAGLSGLTIAATTSAMTDERRLGFLHGGLMDRSMEQP